MCIGHQHNCYMLLKKKQFNLLLDLCNPNLNDNTEMVAVFSKALMLDGGSEQVVHLWRRILF